MRRLVSEVLAGLSVRLQVRWSRSGFYLCFLTGGVEPEG